VKLALKSKQKVLSQPMQKLGQELLENLHDDKKRYTSVIIPGHMPPGH
jgi:hypothetical protein